MEKVKSNLTKTMTASLKVQSHVPWVRHLSRSDSMGLDFIFVHERSSHRQIFQVGCVDIMEL